MRVALYLRVSTDKQTTDPQRLDLERYCQARGWEIVGRFEDLGLSGTRDRRAGLDQLMIAARRREFDVIAVAALDRLGRSTRHLLNTLQEFADLGVSFISLREGFDTSTAAGKLLMTVVAAIGEFERALIVERVRAGLRAAKAKGRTLGRPRRIVDVELARMLRAEGRPSKEIARLMGVKLRTLQRVLATRG
ncbi:MAG TPA: recombinase family protein [Terriglobales bacterium]|nr:recombinase family protein [Terriglobales bacterium]